MFLYHTQSLRTIMFEHGRGISHSIGRKCFLTHLFPPFHPVMFSQQPRRGTDLITDCQIKTSFLKQTPPHSPLLLTQSWERGLISSRADIESHCPERKCGRRRGKDFKRMYRGELTASVWMGCTANNIAATKLPSSGKNIAQTL